MTTVESDRVLDELLGDWLPSEDEIGALDPADQAALLGYLARRLTRWTFDLPVHGRLNEKARMAEAIVGKVDWLCYGGAAGGAKSEFGLKHQHDLSAAIAGHSGLILRTSKPELRRSIVMRSIARFRQLKVDARLRSTDNVLAWHYANGSTMEFGYCARPEDVGQYLSAEYDTLWFDESTQFSWADQILPIVARVRTTVDKAHRGVYPHVVLTTNPGSQSHAQHRSVFIEPTDYGRWIVVFDVSDGMDPSEKPLRVVRRVPMPATVDEARAMEPVETGDDEISVAFIQSKADDNPHLDRSYRKFLSALPELERRQKRDGDWDTFTGQFFAEFNRDLHVVPSFDPPESWYRARALDYGYSNPYCCLWGAWDEDDVLWIYRETYHARMTPSEQAKQVLELSRRKNAAGVMVDEKIARTAADPAVWAQTGAGDPIGMQWQRHGLRVTRANNNRRAGWSNVREYLLVDPATGKPRVRIMDCCTNLIRTIPLMQRDTSGDGEDLLKNDDDHACDTLRYLAMIRPRHQLKAKPSGRTGREGSFDRMLAALDKKRRPPRGSHPR